MRVCAFDDLDPFTVDDDFARPLPNPVPWHTPRSQFPHGLGARIDEHAHDFLVGAPITAAHRILEMNVLVVAMTLDAVGEAGLHATLGGG